jgi:hypothetical protein
MPDNTIEEAFVRAYESTLDLLTVAPGLQAEELFRVERFVGERKDFPQAGGVQLQPKTGRAQKLPEVNVAMRNRWIFKEVHYARDWIDDTDKVRMLADPTNAVVQAFADACRVKKLQIACAAALGNAYAGKTSTTPVVLPNSQKIAAGGTSFTLAKLKAAVKQLRKKGGLLPGMRPKVLWTTDEEDQFINTTEVKSSEFNNTKVMVNGELREFYGCDFVRLDDWYDQISDVTATILPLAGGERSCIVMDPRGVALGLPPADQRQTRGMIDWDKDRWSWQVSAGVDCGAGRLNDFKVVEVKCAA